ncbi:MAG: hypothetical protein K2K16_03355 [Ruminococcus sp.]|nr:hypothetical protein [Ruminococcus sp.]
MKRFVTAILSVAMSAVVCMPLASGYAECENEDSLLPYRDMLQVFNATHGTTYAFATDEQLERTGSDYKTVEDFYTAMTLDEFSEYLENIYVADMEFMESLKDIATPLNDDNTITADTMPYYIKEEPIGEQVEFSVPNGKKLKPSDKNTMNVVLLEN